MSDLENLNLRLHSLVIFHHLLDNQVIKKLSTLISSTGQTPLAQIDIYSSLIYDIYQKGDNLSDYIWNLILEDENIYILKEAEKKPIDEMLKGCLKNELKTLEELALLTADEVRKYINYDGYLPQWKNNYSLDFYSLYKKRMKNISLYGYGIFANNYVFFIKEGKITPVRFPDQTSLTDLKGYRKERQTVIDNTISLLKGKPAANVLLYGDAGTGKSSTVKAVVNKYKDQGLRLIEIGRKQFHHIPEIVESLSNNPLKFILFIDDLSFDKDNDDFKALKATLEGSVFAKIPNLVIYATSNRRHLVKESFSERNGDDIHRNETIQELVSLSERFGLTVNFAKPDKESYLEIVKALSEQYNINLYAIELEQRAEQYALEHSGRSPRVAKQFIEYLKSQE